MTNGFRNDKYLSYLEFISVMLLFLDMKIQTNYQKQKEEALLFYNSLNSIYSPVFKEKVIFSTNGFNHIIYKKSHSEREKSSQSLRFELLPLASKLIEITTTYQEYEEFFREFIIKKHKKRIKENKLVKYWGLIAIIDGQKIKVIIKKVGDNGLLHFWSIIPNWSTSKYRDEKIFSTMNGQPEED